MSEPTERPVLSGLVALVGVGLVVGLLAGITALMGTKVLGVGGGGADSTQNASSGQSLFLPDPVQTDTPSGPLMTLDPNSPTPSVTPSDGGSSAPSATGITLLAGQTQVAAMGQIDLTGVYPDGEGAILQVQRFEDGSWVDFPVTVSVGNQTFATYVMTSRPGENKFRVVDTDTAAESNEVVVTVG
ncbi:hypothetical protein [Nocardioides sp. LHG3406-4]|uniref:hypothetical protein n=1 Tax=Nocardioides sp. LHG3406-4 TaxID=2804575 RepID=UPI003CED1C0A